MTETQIVCMEVFLEDILLSRDIHNVLTEVGDIFQPFLKSFVYILMV